MYDIDPILLLPILALVLFAALVVSVLRGQRGKGELKTRLEGVTRSFAEPLEPAENEPRLLQVTRAQWVPDVLKPVAHWLERALEATGNRLKCLHLVAAALAGGLAGYGLCGMLLKLSLWSIAAASLAAAAALPWLLLGYFRTRHQNRFLDLFPDAIDLIVRAIRSGLPVSEALNTVGREVPDPVGVEYRRVADEMRIGVDVDEALQRAAGRIRLADFHFFVVSLSLQRETGGNLSETLENLSSIIRRRKELRLKARAMTSEARSSAMVIGALPFFASGMLSLLNPDYMGKLFTDPRGSTVIGIAILSLSAGVGTMQLIIKRSLRT